MSGRIVILNGTPRAGKSSIAAAMQTGLAGRWINLGVDAQNRMLPPALLPGIGLRPGGERPDLEPVAVALFGALYESIAAHARAGFDVVADVGHHEGYSQKLDILRDAARGLAGFETLLVGVDCPLDVIMARRNADPQGRYLGGETVPAPVQRWQDAVHAHGVYDLRVDSSVLSAEACAAAIGVALVEAARPRALERLAG